jgi:hypothetical protein
MYQTVYRANPEESHPLLVVLKTFTEVILHLRLLVCGIM